MKRRAVALAVACLGVACGRERKDPVPALASTVAVELQRDGSSVAVPQSEAAPEGGSTVDADAWAPSWGGPMSSGITYEETRPTRIQARKWGRPVEDCSVSLYPEHLTVAPDGPVAVEVEFRNGGTKPLQFPQYDVYKLVSFSVLYQGQWALHTPYFWGHEGIIVSASSTTLAPGQGTGVIPLYVDRVYDMRRTGTYYVRATIEVRNPSWGGFMKVVSNEITVDVVEK